MTQNTLYGANVWTLKLKVGKQRYLYRPIIFKTCQGHNFDKWVVYSKTLRIPKANF